MRHFSRCLRSQVQLKTRSLSRNIHGSAQEIPVSDPSIPAPDHISATGSAIEDVIVHEQEETKNEDIRKLLKQFILPIDYDSTAKSKSVSKPKTPNDELENPELRNLYFNWNISTTGLLPLYNHSNLNPFEFHSTTNEDDSYITSPRLSVTKLLTESWCELRDFYTIYAGSPRFVPTAAIKLGLERHSELERTIHEIIDSEPLVTLLTTHFEESRVAMYDFIEKIEDEETVIKYSAYLEDFTKFAIGNDKESQLALEWSDQIISRMFVLMRRSEAREILVHGFINLHDRKFLTTSEELKSVSEKSNKINESRVLVSGIVDHFKFVNEANPEDKSLFQKINAYLESEHSDNGIDFKRYFEDVPSIIEKYSDNYKLKTTDVKTRSVNRVPAQESVLQAAKYQVFYYRKMLGLLSNESKDDPHFAYHSLIENAKTRNLNVDEPINVITMITILRKYPKLFLNDFLKLSRGEPIGFEPFDEFTKVKPFQGTYNLGLIIEDINNKNFGAPYKTIEIDDLEDVDPFNYHEILPSEILGNWTIPPTLRYFAARGSQFYTLMRDMLGTETSVEYHNGHTGRRFKTLEYDYNTDILNKQISLASTFWTGDRFPMHTNNIKKCNYCPFQAKCLIPNSDIPVDHDRKSLGPKISQFLHS